MAQQLRFNSPVQAPRYQASLAKEVKLVRALLVILIKVLLVILSGIFAECQRQCQHLNQQIREYIKREYLQEEQSLAIAIETTQARQDSLEHTLAEQQATITAEMADLHASLQTELQQWRQVRLQQPQSLAPLKQQLRLHTQRLKRVELEQQQVITHLTTQIEALSQRLTTLEQSHPQTSTTLPATALWHSNPGQAKRPQRPGRDRVAVFIDGSNINCSAHHAQISLDYPALISSLVGGNPLSGRYYFGGMVTGDQAVLRRHQGLQSQGFTVYARQERDGKANQDIALALEMLRLAPQFDTALLLSGDGDFIPVVQQLQGLGKRVEVASFDSQTHHRLRHLADSYIELGSLVAAVA